MNSFEKTTAWFTIIGTIVSSYLAGWAIYLTISYEHLDKKTDLLNSIVLKNDSLLKNTIEQNKILLSQLEILQKQYSLTNKIALTEEQVYWDKYCEDISNFNDVLFNKITINPQYFLFCLTNNQKTKILDSVSIILERIRTNPIVIKDYVYSEKLALFTRFSFNHFKLVLSTYNVKDSSGFILKSDVDPINKEFRYISKKIIEIQKFNNEFYKKNVVTMSLKIKTN